MKIPTERLEAAMRQKRQAVGEQARLAKRVRRRTQAGPAQTEEVPAASMPAEEPAREVPAEEAVPGPLGAEVEEGEIPTTVEVVMVVLDSEEEAPAAVDLTEVGQVTVASGPPAPAEPEVEKAPPSAGEGKGAVRRPDAGARRSNKHRAKPGSSFWRTAHCPTHQPIDEMPEQPARPTPRLSTMGDAGQATILLSGARSSKIDEEMGQLSHAAIPDMVLVNVLQLANGALALRAAVTHSREVLARTMERVDKCKKLSTTLFGKLTWQQEEAKARKEDLGGRIKESECRAEIEAAEPLRPRPSWP